MDTLNSQGIISTGRVKEFGEVFTPDTIVNDMLSLVDEKLSTEINNYVSTTYLEPSCGDGQFLIRILSRKLEKIKELPLEQRELALIKSLSSIYGVDIQPDNVIKARNRMLRVATGQKVSTFDLNNKTNVIKIELGINYSQQLIEVIEKILEWNIIVGNTLEPDNVILKSYHFNGRNVSIAKALLSSLQLEFDKTEEVDYMNIIRLDSVDSDDDDEDFDF